MASGYLLCWAVTSRKAEVLGQIKRETEIENEMISKGISKKIRRGEGVGFIVNLKEEWLLREKGKCQEQCQEQY